MFSSIRSESFIYKISAIKISNEKLIKYRVFIEDVLAIVQLVRVIVPSFPDQEAVNIPELLLH